MKKASKTANVANLVPKNSANHYLCGNYNVMRCLLLNVVSCQE